jgi:hypothetical protein
MATNKAGWIIGQYTGDPYKDCQVNAGTTACVGNYATVTVDGQIYSALAVGTTAGAEVGARCTSTAAELTAGSAIFCGSAAATDTLHYFIVSSGKA